MNYKLITLIGMMLMSINICKAQKKIAYEFPAEMKAPVRVEYEKLADKGQILWNINCAKCHNTKVKGKVVVPDFSLDQLRGYELRVANPDHESGIPETDVTAEELGLIMTFLTYKKKNK
jgi:hypothetical protein